MKELKKEQVIEPELCKSIYNLENNVVDLTILPKSIERGRVMNKLSFEQCLSTCQMEEKESNIQSSESV